MDAEERKVLLEHLGAQYKIYRDDVRLFITTSAASIPLLAFLLFGELAAARGTIPNAKLYVLIPVSVAWYGAVLSLIQSFLTVAAEYSELIEEKMNLLLKDGTFSYESRYILPRHDDIKEIALFGALTLVSATVIPVAGVAGYVGLTKGFDWPGYLAVLLMIGFGVICVFEFCVVIWVRESRKRLNRTLLQKWKNDLGVED